MTLKDQLRREMKERLGKTNGEEFRSQGEKALALLRPTPLWSGYSKLFIFLSMDTEIDTEPFIEAALEEGKKVFAPKTEPGGKLEFYPVLDIKGPWHEGPYGIREPRECTNEETEKFPALIISPGLAFDGEGKRLGRGKGYYDRFFTELEKKGQQFFALGLCMDFQYVSKVPIEKKDKKMNGILTGNIFFITQEV